MKPLQAALVGGAVSLVSLTLVAPAAEAAPVCGPMGGNQIMKTRTCVNPDWAPECAAYTEYWQYGGHYGYMCYGVGGVGGGDPRNWTVEDILGLAGDVIDDRLPVCSSYGNQPANYRVCVDPRSSCRVEVTVEVLRDETRGCA